MEKDSCTGKPAARTTQDTRGVSPLGGCTQIEPSKHKKPQKNPKQKTQNKKTPNRRLAFIGGYSVELFIRKKGDQSKQKVKRPYEKMQT